MSAKSATSVDVDEELLEFLGGEDADTGDEHWLDYLSQTDLDKAARTNRAAGEVKK